MMKEFVGFPWNGIKERCITFNQLPPLLIQFNHKNIRNGGSSIRKSVRNQIEEIGESAIRNSLPIQAKKQAGLIIEF